MGLILNKNKSKRINLPKATRQTQTAKLIAAHQT